MSGKKIRNKGPRRQLTVEDRFPLGRKHCGGPCTRWRHLVDFPPRRDSRYGDQRRWPSSWCTVCLNRRSRRSEQPRRVKPQSRDQINKERREKWAKTMAEIKADPERHRDYKEEKRLRAHDERRAKKVPAREFAAPRAVDLESPIRVNPSLFLEWALWNKPVLTGSESRAVLRSRDSGQLLLDIIDRIMLRNGAGILVNQYYPPEERDA